MLVFTGDICLCDKAFDIGFGIGSKIAQEKMHPFEHLQKGCDEIWIGNFEGVVADTTDRNDYTKDSFRISSDVFDKCGSFIDYWGMANNHVMEHGPKAYGQMEDILKNKCLGVFGSDAHRSISFTHQGKSISITGLSLRIEEGKYPPTYWHLPELKELEQEFNKIRESDFKVLYIHWGVEYVNYPSVEQKLLAHWLIDLGYDLIIGMHPHVLQGYEIYKGKFIFYSLGNFVFSKRYEPSNYSAVVVADLDGGEIKYKYIHIDKNGCPSYLSDKEIPHEFCFETLNTKLKSQKNQEKYITSYQKGLKAYRRSNNLDMLSNIFKYRATVLISILIGFVKRKLCI